MKYYKVEKDGEMFELKKMAMLVEIVVLKYSSRRLK